MKLVFKTFLISCWVRVFHLWQFFINLFRYYLWNGRFFLIDCSLFFYYFFQSPFGTVRKYDEAHPDSPIGPYGETEFSACEKILSDFEISSIDSFVDMGSGRGRLCFWLRLIRRQKRVIGIEQHPLFVERAKKVQNWFHVSDLTFLQENWETVSLDGADVIYLYGSALDEDAIVRLGAKLMHLKKGTKIITTSYWLGEFFPNNFRLEKTTSARFIWGRGEVFLQRVC